MELTAALDWKRCSFVTGHLNYSSLFFFPLKVTNMDSKSFAEGHNGDKSGLSLTEEIKY